MKTRVDGIHKMFNVKKYAIILSVLLAIVITVLVSSYISFNELEGQLRQNLEDVANQNSLALYNKIHSNHLLLESLSGSVSQATPDTIEEILDDCEIFLQDYSLKRFGYLFPDGTCYSTDSGVTDLSYREFFQRGMEGKGTISEVLDDALDEKHTQVNVMTIPIYDESGEVEGVFGLTYDSRIFNDALQIDCFDGKGYSCAFNEKGQIMVAMGNDILQLSENVFTDVLGGDKRNEDTIDDLKKLMKENTSGGGTFYLEEGNYYYCNPVSLMDGDVVWYMLTIIPADVLGSRVAPIQRSLYIMALIVVVLILIGVTLVIILSREQNTMMLRYAYEDVLTKGANYAKFCIDMEKKLGRQGYLVSMDIINFNSINIAAGKATGDIVIGDIWKILIGELQGDEDAGHVREDVFIMFLATDDKEKLLERLNRIDVNINRLGKRLQVKGIHARYGIFYMQGTEKTEDAYSKAQIAREYAKTYKEQNFLFYDEMDHEKLQLDQQLEERFEDSLVEGEFEVWYQPKYSVATGEVVGSEALVRWRNKDGSMISPGSFIPLFEQNGMISKLDEYMFRAVCRQQAKWLQEGKRIYPVSINLSRASLYYADIVDKYKAIMQENEIDPKYIQIEVTESAMEGKADIRRILEKFRNMGIRILMDDFGTGYSSLSTLNLNCFDTLKIDKSLIDHIGDKNGEILLYYVINMGQQLGFGITAEGVENTEQLAFLKENNCDDIQGFLFARPMSAIQFERVLQ